MAFHQPTAPPPRSAAPRPHSSSALPSHPQLSIQRPIDDSQEWVLFSPSQAQESPTLSTDWTPRTAGLSRLSDFGSLNTVGRTDADEQGLSDVLEDSSELDSLDDGLHAFREPVSAGTYSAPSPRRLGPDLSGGSILPAHDGLGMFPASSGEVQDQLWSHERYNPRRRSYGHHRTTSSVHRRLQALDDEVPHDDAATMDDHRLERIQRWRMEQSKILVEEYSKEKSKEQSTRSVSIADAAAEGALVKSHVSPALGNNDEGDSIWQRITRTVIRNLVGIDDRLLAVILGEELIEEQQGLNLVSEAFHESRKVAGSTLQSLDTSSEWETRLIRRIAKELGHLVSSISATPRALPSPLDPARLDYAGLPVSRPEPIPEEPRLFEEPLRASETTSPPFHPTLAPRSISGGDVHAFSEPKTPTVAEIEYWEQTPDLKTVFSYLAQRFLSSRRVAAATSNPAAASASTSNIATANTPASLHRAHLISQHHPLLARPRRRRASTLHSQALYHHHHHHLHFPAGPPNTGALGLGSVHGGGLGVWKDTRPGSLKRVGTSCASVSTKRSRRDGSDAGSRNYWDTGDAGGAASAGVGSEGGFAWMGVGGWGEV